MVVIPAMGKQRQVGPWACWPACLVYLAKSRLVRDLTSKNKGAWYLRYDTGSCSLAWKDTHTHTGLKRE